MPLLVLLAQLRKRLVLQSQVGRLGGWVGGGKLKRSRAGWDSGPPCKLPSSWTGWNSLPLQSTHLKLIAELYDKCQEVCTQVRCRRFSSLWQGPLSIELLQLGSRLSGRLLI